MLEDKLRFYSQLDRKLVPLYTGRRITSIWRHLDRNKSIHKCTEKCGIIWSFTRGVSLWLNGTKVIFFYIALNQRELARKLEKRILYLHQVSQKSEERGQKFADMENVGIFLQLLIILNVLNIRIKYSFSWSNS